MQELSTQRSEWTLSDYAREINREYEIVRNAENAILRIGAMLNEVKRMLPHGKFTPWIKENCRFGQHQASVYMRVESNKHEFIEPPISLRAAGRELEHVEQSQIGRAHPISTPPEPPPIEEVADRLSDYIRSVIQDPIRKLREIAHYKSDLDHRVRHVIITSLKSCASDLNDLAKELEDDLRL